MKLPDSDMAVLAVQLQACLRACGDEAAEPLANDVPWQRGAAPAETRHRIAVWMRRAMALLSTRLDEIPEGTTVNYKEANRRLHDAALLGIQATMFDPILSPLIPDADRQDIEDGLRSMDEVMDAVKRGMAGGGKMLCAECGTTMSVLFSSIQCPFCGSSSVRS